MLRQIRFLFQQFYITYNGSQRRLDIMGHIRHQVHLHLLALHPLTQRRIHPPLYLTQIFKHFFHFCILRQYWKIF